jgi:DNA-binding response OmpR family regulator
MKVLLVEDDPDLGQSLRSVLLANQYVPTWVRTAESAKQFCQSEPFDLALFDIMLPGGSGLELLTWCRSVGLLFPIMMITARDAVSDRVAGLDGGADDYLPKPFAMEELLSRMRVLVRRQSSHRLSQWCVGDLIIDTQRFSVRLKGQDVALSPREYRLLHLLAISPGAVVTRHQLSRTTSDGDLNDSNVLDVHIHSLRKKIGAKRITTVRGVGFILEEKA